MKKGERKCEFCASTIKENDIRYANQWDRFGNSKKDNWKRKEVMCVKCYKDIFKLLSDRVQLELTIQKAIIEKEKSDNRFFKLFKYVYIKIRD